MLDGFVFNPPMPGRPPSQDAGRAQGRSPPSVSRDGKVFRDDEEDSHPAKQRAKTAKNSAKKTLIESPIKPPTLQPQAFPQELPPYLK